MFARIFTFSLIVAPFSAPRGAFILNPSVSCGPTFMVASIGDPPIRSGTPRLKHIFGGRIESCPLPPKKGLFGDAALYAGAISSLNTMSSTSEPSTSIFMLSIFCRAPIADTGPISSSPNSSITESLSSSYGSVVFVSPELVCPPADKFVVAKSKSKSIFLATNISPIVLPPMLL